MPEADTEWVEDTFGDRVEEADDVTIDDVVDWYEDKLAQYDDRKMARIAVQADFNEWLNSGPDGNVRMITIGGSDGAFGQDNLFMGYALCIPDDRPVKLGTVRLDREKMDVDSVIHYFYDPFTPIQGEFDISTHGPPVGDNAYQIEAVQQTKIEKIDSEKTREERKEMVHDFVPSVQIDEVGKNLSLQNDEGWPAASGIDMKVIEGAFVLESRVGESAARLVLQDDSFIDARDLDDSITGGDDGDAGLSGFADPELADFGEGSFIDVYAALTPNQEGQVTMSVHGIDVIEGTEPENGSSGSDSGSSAEEEDIGGGAGVDEERTI